MVAGLATTSNRQALEAMVDRVDDLKVFPIVAQRVNELAQTSNWSMRSLVKVLEADPVLCGRLLRLANSPFYGRKTVTEVRTAAMTLGIRQTRDMALALALAGMKSDSPLHAVLWRRSLRAGYAAQLVAGLSPATNAGDAFTAGLLVDLGRLLLLTVKGQPYEALSDASGHGAALITAERALYGFCHALLGAECIRRWRLPEEIALAVALHHEPFLPRRLSSREFALAAVLRVAGDCADALDEGIGADELAARLLANAPPELRMSAVSAARLAKRVVDEVDAVAAELLSA